MKTEVYEEKRVSGRQLIYLLNIFLTIHTVTTHIKKVDFTHTIFQPISTQESRHAYTVSFVTVASDLRMTPIFIQLVWNFCPLVLSNFSNRIKA